MLNGRAVKGVVVDIEGVLREGDHAIAGSVEALQRLRASGLSVRFASNSNTQSLAALLHDLNDRMGFQVSQDDLFTCPVAACQVLKTRGLSRPLLLVHRDLAPDFEAVLPGSVRPGAPRAPDAPMPDSVVVGNMQNDLAWSALNQALGVLLGSPSAPIIALSKTRFMKGKSGSLEVASGPIAAALEYAASKQSVVAGKPSGDFFRAAVAGAGVDDVADAVMIGDDIETDVGGAQKAGLRGILVRTGKYRKQDEEHPTVKPDAIVNDFSAAVDLLLSSQ
eukprot:m51a1_g3413 hypothetical protein (278) ;mRNA; r:575014-575905